MNIFNPDNESSFRLLLDANNLCGGVMEKRPLPLKDFQKVEMPLQENLKMDIDSDVGYIFEVGLEYPDYLHGQHKDFPVAQTKENIEEKFLSDFQLNLLEKMGVKNLNHQKLMDTEQQKQLHCALSQFEAVCGAGLNSKESSEFFSFVNHFGYAHTFCTTQRIESVNK